MLITIDKSVLSSAMHLSYDNEKDQYSWSSKVKDSSYIITDSSNVPKDLNEICRLYDMPEIFPDFGPFKKAFSSLTSSKVPWYQVIPRQMMLDIIKETFKKSQFLESLQKDEKYIKTFLKERKFLCSMNNAYIDKNILKSHIDREENATTRKILSGFSNENAVCDKIVYSQTSTTTGRLVVKKGPNVLVLSKKHRDIFKSRYQGGKIIEVDFVSLEPMVLSNLKGIDVGDDIYLTVRDRLFDKSISRSVAKHIILSCLYGASESKIMSISSGLKVDKNSIRKVKDFFKINDILRELKAEIKEHGNMFNFFGRRIKKTDDHRIISHYLQSTAVDVALLGFSSLVDDLKELGALPLFVVHDALILDTSPEGFKLIQERVNRGVDINGLGNFPLKAKPFDAS